jgi:L-asparaginase II
MNPILVEAWRGKRVESFHRGAFAAVDAAGAIAAAQGDIQPPVDPRSAIKVLQAL